MERNNLGSIFFFKDRKQLGSKVGFLKRSGHAFIWRIKVAERWLRILKMSLPRACVLLVFMMFDSITGHLSFSSVAQSCPTLCNPMDYSTPGFPVLHYLPELAQTHVHWLNQWCHPTFSSCHPLLLLPSIFPSIRVFSNESVLCIRWPKYWSFSIIPPMNIQGWFPLGWTGLISLLSR